MWEAGGGCLVCEAVGVCGQAAAGDRGQEIGRRARTWNSDSARAMRCTALENVGAVTMTLLVVVVCVCLLVWVWVLEGRATVQ